jgi:hypothetical protein
MFQRALLGLASLTLGALVCSSAAANGAIPAPASAPRAAVAPKYFVVDVVKIMSFSCSVCLSSESQDGLIEAETAQTGGRFVRAPIPVQDGENGVREKVYYAARDIDARFGEAVKVSIYKALHESGVQLNDLTQIYYWLMQDMPEHESRFNQLFKAAAEPGAADPLGRAARLVKSAGATQLPTYVLLVNGVIQGSFDPTTSKSGSLSSLREDVVSRVKFLANPK